MDPMPVSSVPYCCQPESTHWRQSPFIIDAFIRQLKIDTVFAQGILRIRYHGMPDMRSGYVQRTGHCIVFGSLHIDLSMSCGNVMDLIVK